MDDEKKKRKQLARRKKRARENAEAKISVDLMNIANMAYRHYFKDCQAKEIEPEERYLWITKFEDKLAANEKAIQACLDAYDE